MAGPLDGIKVLDLSRVLAGPWASQTLADLGASVIKIERPKTGDDTRAWGPPYAKDAVGNETTESAYFLSANRGKKSVTVDITSAQGQAIVTALAEKSDIVIENFKVGALSKYRLDYATLSRLNPRLIYCSITGFGQSGPYAHLPGYDFMIQGLGGLMSISGLPDGVAGASPMKTGVAVADLFSGMYAATAILAALNRRHATGRGDFIDIALLDVQVAMLANQAMNYLTTGTPPQRLGNAHPNIVPYEVFAVSDGHIVLAVGNDQQFAAFCAVADLDHLAADPRFAANRARVKNRLALIPLIAKTLLTRKKTDWLTALNATNVPCGPINDMAAVFADPQVRDRGLELKLGHSIAGTVPSVASPMRFASGLQSQVATSGPPALGEHTEDVLQDQLGLSRAQILSLSQQNVV